MSYIIQGDSGDWEVVVGLEVHAQATTNSKLFSGAPTTFGASPNENVSLVDAAMPGMLPVINEMAIEQAVRTGLGLRAQINRTSVFERKNYFYADLPQGYQISQYLHPIVGEGVVTLDLADGSTRDVGIERLHLEQDAGKSMHDQDPKRSMIDLNRAGVVLMEIVSKPDIRTPEEAVEKANNTPYGLSAGIWTDKGSRILEMASKLKAGVVWANTYNKFDPSSPFGGFKESGFGREGGGQGLLDYTRTI